MKAALITSLTALTLSACSPSATGARGDQATPADANGAGSEGSSARKHADANTHAMSMDAMMQPQPGDSPATRGYKASMTRMMDGMPAYTGDADIDFNKQMRVHHLAAIDMAQVQLAHGKDAPSRALATKIIADQKREVAQIDAWLRQRGQ